MYRILLLMTGLMVIKANPGKSLFYEVLFQGRR